MSSLPINRFAWKVPVAGLLMLPLATACNKQAPPPNVIIILTDDQGYGDIGIHGNPVVKTPVQDSFHSQCVSLTNFHVDPCCAPTRSALLTGQYSSRTGVWHTIGGRSLLGTNNVTMAEVFRDGGYATGIFGKWHLGENFPFRPMDRGFQESVVHGGGGVGSNPDYSGNDYFDDTYKHNGRPEKYSGYCNTVWFTEAMKFIRKNQDHPFFCYVATNVPHAPLTVDSSYSTAYRGKVSDRLANYYGMITKLDEDLGVFLKELELLKLTENTIVIFMTDNGPCPWFGGIVIDEQGFPVEGYSCGMRGGKIWGYENAHRVPCFIRWPDGGIGGTGKGREIDKLAAHIDVLPTLIRWCGLNSPENGDFDGVSLDPLIRGTVDTWPERTLFVHNQRVDYPEKYKEYQVLTEEWRLLNRDSLELYNIRKDPGQKVNVAAENGERVQWMVAQYEQWWDHISSNFDSYNPIILGSARQNPAMIYSHDAHRPEGEPIFWVVDFSVAGEYEFTVYLKPPETGAMLAGTTVTGVGIQVGDVVMNQRVAEGPDGLSFKMKIPAGQTRIQAWFDRAGKRIAPYSIDVKIIN